MSNFASAIQRLLATGEIILSSVDNIRFGFGYVPHVRPMDNEATPPWSGGIALTNRRLVVVYGDHKYVYSTKSIRALSERLHGVKPNWPYQATIYLPVGQVLTVETAKQDMETRGQHLSHLLNQALFLLGDGDADESAITAILDYEEQKKRE